MNQFLSIENLYRKAPSIFTKESGSHTSDKYQYISTLKIIEELYKEGFRPTYAIQSNSRSENKIFYAKHCVRFRHANTTVSKSRLFPELVLVNSHDGLSSYRLYAGLYRLVCSNGLVAGEKYEDVRIRHQGDIIGNVLEGTFSIIETAKHLIEISDKMASVTINEEEQALFAETAHQLRFEGSETGLAIAPKNLLLPRRIEDTNKSDLFTVFNIIQENVIKGRVIGRSIDKYGYPKRIRSREVKSIDQNTTLNRSLWTVAEKILQLKGIY